MADNKKNNPDSKAKPTPPIDQKEKSKNPPAGKKPAPVPLASRRNVYIIFILLLSAGIGLWKFYFGPKLSAPYNPEFTANSQFVGMPKIGGPFTLIDQNGRTVTDADFKGRHILVYFGYTFCPDVCPTSLTIMSDALDLLGDKADKVTPVFVTVDPERDTPEFMKMYVEHFHPRLVGLTGSLDQVASAAKAYKVFYEKVGDAYGNGEYTMDHSSFTYLMGPDGNLLAHFRHGTGAEKMSKKMAEFL